MIEDIKKIAESLYPDQWEEFETFDGTNEKYIVVGGSLFDPLNNGDDFFCLLSALLEKREKVIFIKDINSKMLEYGPLYILVDKDLKRSIYNAYLATLE